MITSTLKLATGMTFYELQALARSRVLVTLGGIILALFTLTASVVVKGQNRVRT